VDEVLGVDGVVGGVVTPPPVGAGVGDAAFDNDPEGNIVGIGATSGTAATSSNGVAPMLDGGGADVDVAADVVVTVLAAGLGVVVVTGAKGGGFVFNVGGVVAAAVEPALATGLSPLLDSVFTVNGDAGSPVLLVGTLATGAGLVAGAGIGGTAVALVDGVVVEDDLAVLLSATLVLAAFS